LGEKDEEVENTIRAGPKEQDRYKASPIRRYELFDIYGLDGNTYIVQIA